MIRLGSRDFDTGFPERKLGRRVRYSSVESALYRAREWARRVLEEAAAPFARFLARLHVTPNQVSLAGLALNAGAAAVIVEGELVWAGATYILAGSMDLLDGTLARTTAKAGRFGAFFDSTLDRVSEGIVFAAITYRFAVGDEELLAAATVIALLGSLLVSYVRARAEGLGGECKVGLLTRAERVVLLTAGLLADLLPAAIILLAVLTTVTVIQRIRHVARQFAPNNAENPADSQGAKAGD